MEGTPPGDALPPPPQRATPARKGARSGAGAGSTRPHRPHPGHTGCGTLAARSRGRAVGGRTAPDTRRPTQRWKAPSPGTPFRHPHSEQRRPARAHTGGPVLGSHARIDRTRDTRVAEPRPPAPEDGRSGEGQRLTPGAPHNTVEGTPPGDALPPPPQRATPARKGARCGAGAGSTRPHRPHPGHTGRGTLAARSRGRAAGGGTAPDTRRPSQRWKAPPPGTPFHHPHSEQRRPARAHAGGPVLGTHARIDRTRDTRVAEPWQPAPEDGRPGEGQRLTPGAPHKGGKHPPRGRPSATPTASNTGPRGLTLWGRCGDPTPAPTAPRTRGTRNPGCPLQRTGGQGPPPPQPQAKEGGTGTGPPPPKHARRSTGPGQDTRRGTDQVERPYQRPVPGPREMRAPHHPAGGGADTARARAHTHEKDTRGLPEGQPDRARGTHRPHGMAYQRARVRDTRRGRPATRSAEHAGREGGNRRDTTPGTGPNPPRTGRERRAHTDGTLHPPRQ